MTMISLSGLDLSFLHDTGGGGGRGGPPPKRPASAKRKGAMLSNGLASGDGAMVIDLAKKRVELRGPVSKKAKAAAKAILAAEAAKQKARAKAKRRRIH